MFLYGLIPEEFSLICGEISSVPRLITCPAFVPICLLDLVNEGIEPDLERCRSRTHDIKLELGMGNSNPIVDLSNCDFVPITRALTGLTANLAKCELACEAHTHLLDQLDEELDIWAQARMDEHDSVLFNQDVKSLHKRSGELRRWMQALNARTKYLTRRSQAYVQTVSLYLQANACCRLTMFTGLQSYGAKRQRAQHANSRSLAPNLRSYISR